MNKIELTDSDMEFFRGRPNDDPAVIADAKIKAYAESRGGEVLAYWRLALARIWGDSFMMADAAVSEKLGLPMERLDAIYDETMRACGYRK